jgi:hypothetical protein
MRARATSNKADSFPPSQSGVPSRHFPVQAKAKARPSLGIQPQEPGPSNSPAGPSIGDMPLFPRAHQSNDFGAPLPPAFRRKMEAAFGADFSDVSIHHNAPEPESFSALAFTRGRDLYFAPGQYNPSNPQGQKIIAHELAHVVQQRTGGVEATQGEMLNADPALEQEADTQGARAVRGRRAKTTLPSESGRADSQSGLPGQNAISGSAGQAPPIQRYCGAPGCNDSNCYDESNHGFNRVYDLRSGPLYNFTVNPNDRGQGTNTNQTTRNYVNDSNAYYPQQVRMSYSDGGQSGFTEFENAPLQPGQRADAGHIRGRQNGGFGNQNAGVFAQNPQQNRGNYLNGQPTRDLWRQHEDNQNNWAQNSPVDVSVALRNTARDTYPPESSIPDQEYQEFLRRWSG